MSMARGCNRGWKGLAVIGALAACAEKRAVAPPLPVEHAGLADLVAGFAD